MAGKPKHYIIENKKIMEEWDYEKNNELSIDPNQVGEKSHLKVWWKCNKGHSWYAMIANRTAHDRGCPYCSHQLPITGETDLATLYPCLLDEWDFKKNTEDPKNLMPGTHKKAWWKCKMGHEWKAEIKSRVAGVGCPICANKKILKGFNDLETINPELAKEWHPSKNNELTASQVSPSSGKKVWWKCNYGHEYQTQIYNRSAGKGCPKCAEVMRTSFPEQAIFYYIKQVFPDAINSYKEIFEKSMEVDIFIPSLNVAIEYDGKIYHSKMQNQVRDAKKYKLCKEKGIKLIRIREMEYYAPLIVCDHKLEIPEANEEYLNWAINNLCYYLGKNVIPDIKRDRKKILEYLECRKSSLASTFPDIAEEWNYEANNPLIPENFPPHSNEKVFWTCKQCGNVWEAAIGDRTRREKNGCPRCAHKRSSVIRRQIKVKKQGSLLDLYPALCKEWDYDKNSDISPREVTDGSGKKVHWVCEKCGYNWVASINKRVKGGGCPYCNNRIVINGLNDIMTLFPTLMED